MADAKQRPPPTPSDSASEEVEEVEDDIIDEEVEDDDDADDAEVGIEGAVDEESESLEEDAADEDEADEEATLRGVRDVPEYIKLQKAIRLYMIKVGCTPDDIRQWEAANERSLISERHFYYGLWAYLP